MSTDSDDVEEVDGRRRWTRLRVGLPRRRGATATASSSSASTSPRPRRTACTSTSTSADGERDAHVARLLALGATKPLGRRPRPHVLGHPRRPRGQRALRLLAFCVLRIEQVVGFSRSPARSRPAPRLAVDGALHQPRAHVEADRRLVDQEVSRIDVGHRAGKAGLRHRHPREIRRSAGVADRGRARWRRPSAKRRS